MRVHLLVLVPEPYYLERGASLGESWSDATTSRQPSVSNSVNLEDNVWLKPNFVTVLARQMKLRRWDSLLADLLPNATHTSGFLCLCCPKTFSFHSYVKHGRTATAPPVLSQNTPQSALS